MGILRNGFSIRRSLSPVIMQEAFAETANSRNLLSLGSRQAKMVSEGEKYLIPFSISLSNLSLSASEIKYLSNFLRKITSSNSFRVSSEKAIYPVKIAFLTAFLFTESINKEALIKVFVSNTKYLIIVFQNIIKRFFCKTSLFHFFTNFIKISKEISFPGIIQNLANTLRNLFGNFFLEFGGCKAPFFSSGFVHFNYNSFHSLIITGIVKFTKNKPQISLP